MEENSMKDFITVRERLQKVSKKYEDISRRESAWVLSIIILLYVYLSTLSGGV
jgi:predicted HTH domain antitoxin